MACVYKYKGKTYTEQEFKNYVKKAINNDLKSEGKSVATYENGVVRVKGDQAPETDLVLKEFSQPFIDVLANVNPTLFNNLVNEVKEKNGDIQEAVNSELESETDLVKDKEILGRALSLLGSENFESGVLSIESVENFNEWMQAAAQKSWVRKVSNGETIHPSEITVNTPLSQIVDIFTMSKSNISLDTHKYDRIQEYEDKYKIDGVKTNDVSYLASTVLGGLWEYVAAINDEVAESKNPTKENLEDAKDYVYDAYKQIFREAIQERPSETEHLQILLDNWNTVNNYVDRLINDTVEKVVSKNPQDQITGLRENWDKDEKSFSIDMYKKASKRLKFRLSFIKTGYSNDLIPDYFDSAETETPRMARDGVVTDEMVKGHELYDELMAMLTSDNNKHIEANFQSMLNAIDESDMDKVTKQNLITALENFPTHVQNELVTLMHTDSVPMQMMMWSEASQGINSKIINSNANEVSRIILRNWHSNFLSKKELFDIEDGAYKLDRDNSEVQEFIDTVKGLKNKNKQKVENWKDYGKILNFLGINVTQETWENFNHRSSGNIPKFLAGSLNEKGGLLETYTKSYTIQDKPIRNFDQVYKRLALEESRSKSRKFSKSFFSGNKQVFAYHIKKHLPNKFFKLNRTSYENPNPGSQELIDKIESTVFGKNSMLTAALNGDVDTTIQLVALEAIRKEHDGRNDKKLAERARGDFLMLQLENHINNSERVNKYRKTGKYFFPVMAGRGNMYTIRSPKVRKVADKKYEWDKNKNGDIKAGEGSIGKFLYQQVFLPEYKRMKEHENNDINVDTYADNQFFMFPSLHNVPELWEGDSFIDLKEKGRQQIPGKNLTYGQLLRNEIVESFNDIRENVKQDWVNKGIWDNYFYSKNPVTGKKFTVDKSKKGWAQKQREQRPVERDYLLDEFVTSYMQAYTNMFQTLIGDPALYAKNKVKSPTDVQEVKEELQKSLNNFFKRNDGSAAPAQSIVFDGSKYANGINYLMLKESVQPSDQLAELATRLGDYDSVQSAENALKQLNKLNGKDLEKALKNRFPNSKPYHAIEIADAQEFTTLEHHFDILTGIGQLSEEKANELLEKAENYNLSDEDISAIMNPLKPKYFGDKFEVSFMRKIFVKSSSIPLFPQLTRGNKKLDNLRKTMEKGDEENGSYHRAAMPTAVKLGNIPKHLRYDHANFESDVDVSQSVLQLPSENLGIQQIIPAKENYIKNGTQSRAIIQELLPFIDKINYKGEDIDGSKMKKLYNEKFNELLNSKLKSFRKEFGTLEDFDYRRFKEIFERELDRRGFNITDKMNLEIKKIGDVIKGFKTPIHLLQSSNRFEPIINSIFEDRLLNVELPGNAFVLATEDGFNITEELGEVKNDAVTPVNDWDGNIKAISDNKGYAQVIVPWKLAGNLSDFVQNGKLELNPELLEMFGFRIPTQGSNSIRGIEIVGFLPEGSGDQIIAPKDFVVQMGSDFDIDKLYTYLKKTFVDNNGDLKLVSEENKQAYKQSLLKEYKETSKKYTEALEGAQSQNIESSDALRKGYKSIEIDNPNGHIIKMFEGITNGGYSKFADVQRRLNSLEKNFLKNIDSAADQDIMKNDLVDMHIAITSSDHPLSLKKTHTPLSSGHLSALADMKKKRNLNDKNLRLMSIVNPTLHTDKYFSSRASESGIGTFASANMLNIALQDHKRNIRITNGKSRYSLSISSKPFNQDAVDEGVIKESDKEVRISEYTEGDLSNPFTLSTQRYLSRILGDDYMTKIKNPKVWNGIDLDGVKTKSDVFSAFMDVALDDANNNIMGPLNISEEVFPVIKIMAQQGFDEQNIAMFIGKPSIRRYVEIKDDLKGKAKERDDDLKGVSNHKYAIAKLQNEIFEAKRQQLVEDASTATKKVVQENDKSRKTLKQVPQDEEHLLNLKDFKEELSKTHRYSNSFKNIHEESTVLESLDIVHQFNKLYYFGQELISITSSIQQDTGNGWSSSSIENMADFSKKNQLERTHEKYLDYREDVRMQIVNLDQLMGERVEEGEDAGNKYIEVTPYYNNGVIKYKPNSIKSNAFLGLKESIGYMGKMYPYTGSEFLNFKGTVERYAEVNDFNRKNYMQHYSNFYSDYKRIHTVSNSSAERLRLMMDQKVDGKIVSYSLPSIIQKLKLNGYDSEYRFLRDIDTKLTKEVHSFVYASQGVDFEDQIETNNSVLDFISDDIEIFENYRSKDLIQDMMKFSILTGGTSFDSFLPFFTYDLSRAELESDPDAMAMDFLQNHPQYLPRRSMDNFPIKGNLNNDTEFPITNLSYSAGLPKMITMYKSVKKAFGPGNIKSEVYGVRNQNLVILSKMDDKYVRIPSKGMGAVKEIGGLSRSLWEYNNPNHAIDYKSLEAMKPTTLNPSLGENVKIIETQNIKDATSAAFRNLNMPETQRFLNDMLSQTNENIHFMWSQTPEGDKGSTSLSSNGVVITVDPEMHEDDVDLATTIVHESVHGLTKRLFASDNLTNQQEASKQRIINLYEGLKKKYDRNSDLIDAETSYALSDVEEFVAAMVTGNTNLKEVINETEGIFKKDTYWGRAWGAIKKFFGMSRGDAVMKEIQNLIALYNANPKQKAMSGVMYSVREAENGDMHIATVNGNTISESRAEKLKKEYKSEIEWDNYLEDNLENKRPIQTGFPTEQENDPYARQDEERKTEEEEQKIEDLNENIPTEDDESDFDPSDILGVKGSDYHNSKRPHFDFYNAAKMYSQFKDQVFQNKEDAQNMAKMLASKGLLVRGVINENPGFRVSIKKPNTKDFQEVSVSKMISTKALKNAFANESIPIGDGNQRGALLQEKLDFLINSLKEKVSHAKSRKLVLAGMVNDEMTKEEIKESKELSHRIADNQKRLTKLEESSESLNRRVSFEKTREIAEMQINSVMDIVKKSENGKNITAEELSYGMEIVEFWKKHFSRNDTYRKIVAEEKLATDIDPLEEIIDPEESKLRTLFNGAELYSDKFYEMFEPLDQELTKTETGLDAAISKYVSEINKEVSERETLYSPTQSSDIWGAEFWAYHSKRDKDPNTHQYGRRMVNDLKAQTRDITKTVQELNEIAKDAVKQAKKLDYGDKTWDILFETLSDGRETGRMVQWISSKWYEDKAENRNKKDRREYGKWLKENTILINPLILFYDEDFVPTTEIQDEDGNKRIEPLVDRPSKEKIEKTKAQLKEFLHEDHYNEIMENAKEKVRRFKTQYNELKSTYEGPVGELTDEEQATLDEMERKQSPYHAAYNQLSNRRRSGFKNTSSYNLQYIPSNKKYYNQERMGIIMENDAIYKFWKYYRDIQHEYESKIQDKYVRDNLHRNSIKFIQRSMYKQLISGGSEVFNADTKSKDVTGVVGNTAKMLNRWGATMEGYISEWLKKNMTKTNNRSREIARGEVSTSELQTIEGAAKSKANTRMKIWDKENPDATDTQRRAHRMELEKMFTDRLSKHRQNRDLVFTLKKMIAALKTYDFKQQNVSDLEVFYKNLENIHGENTLRIKRAKYELDTYKGAGRNLGLMPEAWRNFYTWNLKNAEEKKLQARSREQKKQLKKQYDNEEINKDQYTSQLKALDKFEEKLGRNLDIAASITDGFAKFTHLISLAFNPGLFMANAGFGAMTNSLTGAEDRFYKNSSLLEGYAYASKDEKVLKGAGSLMGSVVGSIAASTMTSMGFLLGGPIGYFGGALVGAGLGTLTSKLFKSDTKMNKIANIMQKEDILQKLSNEIYQTPDKSGMNWVGRSWETAKYNSIESSEYLNQAPVLYAILKDIKVEKDGKRISAFDLFNDEGDIIDSDSKIKYLGKERTVQQTVKRVMNAVNKTIQMNHGDYDENTKVQIKAFALGRALIQFRTWMLEGYGNRFDKERYDYDLVNYKNTVEGKPGVVRKGSHMAALNQIGGLGYGVTTLALTAGWASLGFATGGIGATLAALALGVPSAFVATKALTKSKEYYQDIGRTSKGKKLQAAKNVIPFFNFTDYEGYSEADKGAFKRLRLSAAMYSILSATGIMMSLGLRYTDDDEKDGFSRKAAYYMYNMNNRLKGEMTQYHMPFDVTQYNWQQRVIAQGNTINKIYKLGEEVMPGLRGETMEGGIGKGYNRLFYRSLRLNPWLGSAYSFNYQINQPIGGLYGD